MDLNTVLTKTPDAAYRIYDGQATIILPARAEVKVLNELGSIVWDAIDGQRTLGAILDRVVQEFEISREQARDDLFAFLTELHEHGMVS
jgi:hypothetical protein